MDSNSGVGRPIVGLCLKCGGFTLDVVNFLCPSCALVQFLRDPYGLGG